MMRHLLLAAILIAPALPAFAQDGQTIDGTGATAPAASAPAADTAERLMRVSMTGKPSKLDKAADVLTRQGWRWVEVHGDERKPFVAAWRMSKIDAATVAAVRADLRAIMDSYNLQMDKLEVQGDKVAAK